jgi:hypothetical protein
VHPTVPLRVALPLLAALAWTHAATAAPTPTAVGATPPADAAAPAVHGADERLSRLPSIGREPRLLGETDTLSWPVFVSAEEAAAPTRLHLAWETAVAVMPEASRLTVTINDRPIADLAVGTGGSDRSADLALPAGLLEPGWNAVRIVAEQRHRVECTAAATFELWTRIDGARSGLVFPVAAVADRRGLADLAGLAPDADGRRRIRLVSPRAADDPAGLARAFRLAQGVALAGGFLDPLVTVVAAPGGGPGLDVVLTDAGRGPAAGAAASLEAADPTRMTLTLPDDDDAIDRVVTDLTHRDPAAFGSVAGRALRRGLGGVVVASGARVSLAALGVHTHEFSGRLFRAGFDVRLPADLAAGDYGKVSLRLVGGYAAHLDRSSRLTIRVDGRIAVGLRLSAGDGEVFAGRPLEIPFSAFRPGVNRVEIEASVGAAADRDCDPLAARDAAARFLLVDRSELVFPTFARAVRLPDLAATAAGGLADLPAEARPILHLPRPDPATLAAAATFLARVAVTAGRVQDLAVSYRAPGSDDRSALVFAAAGDLGRATLASVGLDAGALREIWGTTRIGDRRIAPAIRIASAFAATSLPRLPAEPATTGSLGGETVVRSDGADPLDRWRRSLESRWSPTALVRDLGGWLDRLFRPSAALATDALGTAGLHLAGSTDLVLAQRATAGGVTTVITAASPDRLLAGVTRSTGRRWAALEGAAVALSGDDEAPSVAAAADRGTWPTRWDPANLRRLAAVRAAELPLVFVALAVLAALALGFATARLLRRQ